MLSVCLRRAGFCLLEVAIFLGFASAVVDNVPLVAAAQASDLQFAVRPPDFQRVLPGHVRHFGAPCK